MIKNSISCNVVVAGRIFNCPAKMMIGKKDGDIICGATVKWDARPVKDVLKESGIKISKDVCSYIDELLSEIIPNELFLTYQKDIAVIELQESELYFKMAMSSDGNAVIFSFQKNQSNDTNNRDDSSNSASKSSALFCIVDRIADFFGISELMFYIQTGEKCLLPIISKEDSKITNIATYIENKKFVVYTHVVPKGDSIFIKAIKLLFNLKEAELFLAAVEGGFECAIAIPEFSNNIMKSNNMCIMIDVGNKVSFSIKGEFEFTFLKKALFKIDCGVGTDGFEIDALAEMDEKIDLFGPISIGETYLTIKMSESFAFGMYTNLYIGKMKIFGAIMLNMQGDVVTPQLLAAAFSDFSIPYLLDNLLGEHIDGIESLEFIRVQGLPFKNMEPFSKEVVEQKKVADIVQRFNEQVDSDLLNLDIEQTQVTSMSDGINVTDLKRMRHYYINSNGILQLSAQFYYATVNTKFGNFSVEKGYFICGSIEIFGKRFEVLLSFREKEGFLAYAKIPQMDLGFLKIESSSVGKNNEDNSIIAKDSVLSQFVDLNQDGVVFFLSAVKSDISFYFDGKIELLSFFSVAARIVFQKGIISIDLQTVWLSILTVSLHLKVEYQKFSSGEFEFCLIIDTSKLTEKLQSVTKKIEVAINQLRDKINDANKEIDRAQAHINELYGQIDVLNQKIDNCRYDISHAKWWKKAFVAIAKGIEIGGYEAAKAGIYASIGVATAALQVAKGVVNLGGKIGENVLKAVNEVINGAMSLFYINYIRLGAKTDIKEQNFSAEIEFVALGKTYQLKKDININKFKSSPEDALSDNINEQLKPDLDNIENGAFKSNWRKYKHEEYTIEQHCNRLDDANQYMASAVNLLGSMQNMYVDEFNISMAEFDEMNVSVMEALSYAENSLSAGTQAGDIGKLSSHMDELKRSVRGVEDSEISGLMAQYDEANLLYGKVVETLSETQKHRETVKSYCENLKERTSYDTAMTVEQSNDGIKNVLEKLEEELYKEFPVDRSGNYFINLSRESLIQECFENAYKEEGIETSEQIKQMRSRSRKGKYNSRMKQRGE